MVAIRVSAEGHRENLGISAGAKENKSGWSSSLIDLVDRGPKGLQLEIPDSCRSRVECVTDHWPDAKWQRCAVHFYRSFFSHMPSTKVRDVRRMCTAIHAQDNRTAVQEKAEAGVSKLRRQRLTRAAERINPMSKKR